MIIKVLKGEVTGLIITGLDNQERKDWLSDNQGFRHVTPNFPNSENDSPHQTIDRIKTSTKHSDFYRQGTGPKKNRSKNWFFSYRGRQKGTVVVLHRSLWKRRVPHPSYPTGPYMQFLRKLSDQRLWKEFWRLQRWGHTRPKFQELNVSNVQVRADSTVMYSRTSLFIDVP